MTEETLIERMRHAATHCETLYDAEWEAQQLRDGAAEIERLCVVFGTAMETLDQIASTPRNKGAKRSAYATVMFLRSQLAMTHNASLSGAPLAARPLEATVVRQNDATEK